MFDNCEIGASWKKGIQSVFLQFWNASSGAPLGSPIPFGEILGEGPGGRVALKAGQFPQGFHGFRIIPVRPTAADLCAKLVANMSRKQWDEWISPDLEYQKACPELPIAPDE
jgi:hypothetical protein